MKSIIRVVAAAAIMFSVLGFGPPRPDVPDALKAPAGEDVVLSGHATGVQIYFCQANTERMPAWVLKAPEADLSDAAGKVIIHHSAGPAWKEFLCREREGKV